MKPARDYSLGQYICQNPHHALLHHCLGGYGGHVGMPEQPMINFERGVALEFGVGSGESLNCIARYLPVIGFDSFKGLPENWRPGFDKGAFYYDFDEVLSRTAPNSVLVPGLFEDTLPGYGWEGMRDIKLIHIDCDLYSSTKTVLENLPWRAIRRPHGTQKAIIIFDEWHGYPGAEQHEQRAWREAAEKFDLDWEIIGHGIQQWAVRIK